MEAGKPLTNNDFRKLLATPRPGAAPDLAAQAAAKKEKKHRPRPGKPPPPGDEDADAEGGPSYRDRAAERRLGLDGLPADMVGLLDGGAGVADLSRLSYEESKYLGGDVEHTHLVKGLDFALLNRMRSEQGREPSSAGEARKSVDAAPAAAAPPPSQGPTFHSPAGRAVYDILFGAQHAAAQAPPSERFLPRRTAFLYNMENGGDAEVPTTLNRSKEDCPRPQKAVHVGIEAPLLERLAKIMAYTSLASKRELPSHRPVQLPAALCVSPVVSLCAHDVLMFVYVFCR